MSDSIQPESPQELDAAIASSKEVVVPIGGNSKPGLHAKGQTVSLAKLSGLVEYAPSEFTFTAWAGTPVADVQAILAEKNQYLPFDPMLVSAGATLGGTVASGISGPGRVRYGGLRDFLLGVRLHSGDGKVIHGGGKVVKNAAGFDIPKLLVGSLGTLGIISELTFKVFPRALSTLTIQADCQSHSVACDRIARTAASRWEVDAIEYRPDSNQITLRLAGPEEANRAIKNDIESTWQCPVEELSQSDAAGYWDSIRELDWHGLHSPVVVRVPITPPAFLSIVEPLQSVTGTSLHLSAASSVLWIAFDTSALDSVDQILYSASLAGMPVCGVSPIMWVGRRPALGMETAVKRAMDPQSTYPSLPS